MIGAHFTSKGEPIVRRDENPLPRTSKTTGKTRFVARYTDRDGQRRSAGTYEKRGPCKRPADDGACCARHAILKAYEAEAPRAPKPITVREYFEGTWLERHPRSERTELNYRGRVKAVLPVVAGGVIFGDLPIRDVRPRHLDDLVDVMLREHGRAASGTRGVIATLSAMFMDAIRDEVADMNPALVVRVRDRDPRVRRPRRRTVLCSFEEMRAFAAAAGEHEAMVRVLSDCGLRLGEMLALECKHVRGDVLVVEQSAWRASVSPGTKQTAKRVTPLPPALGALLAPFRRDEAGNPRVGLLFAAPGGKPWHERSFYRYVWDPARERTGKDLNPHDFRHSYVSWMRSAGVDPADLADATGHTVETATAMYTHSTGATFDLMRRVAG